MRYKLKKISKTPNILTTPQNPTLFYVFNKCV